MRGEGGALPLPRGVDIRKVGQDGEGARGVVRPHHQDLVQLHLQGCAQVRFTSTYQGALGVNGTVALLLWKQLRLLQHAQSYMLMASARKN